MNSPVKNIWIVSKFFELIRNIAFVLLEFFILHKLELG